MENWSVVVDIATVLCDASAGGEWCLTSVSSCDGNIALQGLLPLQGPICYKLVVIIGERFNSKKCIFLYQTFDLPVFS